ncbi:hypothetical protein M422DRAFT_233847 [Sphaerobolus stellatus SS14]|uniref:Uncharacterized protein n=1 Tax=Sphaerobolus stellatus (strain SS14) TaxID=990650 RepID=A0A0C9UUN0_SPHS4|nr:hypothetical protein M422DRAFT_235469 [Sphaerobolus stellatus SS14]KIJ33011.1 hypothetical protein M422DRAFT_233847 [Sphaerobolus stellatus SS14]
MARRSAPPHSGPSYLAPTSHSSHSHVDPNEGWLKRILREEIFSPEKLPGNISILTGVTVFIGGVAAIRTWGEAMFAGI